MAAIQLLFLPHARGCVLARSGRTRFCYDQHCATTKETIVPDSFLFQLKKVLISEEFSYSHQNAERLIGRFPDIVMEGISRRDYPLRDTARALRERERESIGAPDDRSDF